MEYEGTVKTILVAYKCDTCGGSVVKNTGRDSISFNSMTPFKHHCESCYKEYLFDRSYPYTRYVPI